MFTFQERSDHILDTKIILIFFGYTKPHLSAGLSCTSASYLVSHKIFEYCVALQLE